MFGSHARAEEMTIINPETTDSRKPLESAALLQPLSSRDLSILKSEELVYSGSKRIESIKTTINPISVVTYDHLSVMSARYIPEILKLYPGVDVTQLTRTDYNVSVRGFPSGTTILPRDVLFLIDGRTMYDDFSGGVNWEEMEVFPQDIGKIEILRGGGSTIYGPNAARGVVNIFTKPSEGYSSIESETSYGAYNAFRQRLTGNVSHDNLSFRLTTGFDQADLWNAFDGYTYTDSQAAKTWRGNGVFTDKLSSDSDLRIEAGTNFGKTLQTATEGYLFNYDKSSSHLSAEYNNPDSMVRTYWNYRRIKSFDINTDQPLDTRSENLYDFEFNRRIRTFESNQLLVGGTGRYVVVNSEVGLTETATEWTEGIFADDQYNFTEKLAVRIGARLDHHDLAGYQASPRAGVSYKIDPDNVVRASYSVGYRNPTLSDNFFNYTVSFFGTPVNIVGNKNLKPENTSWYDAGYSGKFSRFTVSADAFYFDSNNFIVSGFTDPTTITAQNTDTRVEGYGGELAGEFKLNSNFSLMGNYSYNHYYSGDNVIHTTPLHKANVGLLCYGFDKFSGALTMNYVDKTIWGPDPLLGAVDPYFLTNLFLQYHATSQVVVKLEAINIFDQKHYELPSWYFDAEKIPADIMGSVQLLF